jgi:heptosyltransferase-3
MAYGDYPDLQGIKKILVVKLRHLGDVLLTGPVFTALKKTFPEAQIDAFIWSESVPMLQGHPAIDGFIEYDREWKKLGWKKFLKEWSLLKKIRNKKYDLVLNLTEGDRGALAAQFSRARIKVGFDPKGKGFFGKKNIYTHLIKNCPSLRHTVERNLDAVRRIGIFPQPEQRDLFLHVPKEAIFAMQKKVGFDPFILIHPTSRWRFKCWPIEHMRKLAHCLIERGHRLVFTSGPDPVEISMVEEIVQGISAINLSGKISLKELAALIQQTQTLFCVDSVPLHMASAFKTPTVAIFGPTSEITWGPWRNEKARIVSQSMSCRPCYQDGCGGSKRSDCLTTLSVSKVLSAYDSLWEKELWEAIPNKNPGKGLQRTKVLCQGLGQSPN